MNKILPLGVFPDKVALTLHVKEREERFRKYEALLGAPVVASFYVDRKHANGLEVHALNAEAVAIIYNFSSHKLITVKALRPAQLDAYYVGETVPEALRIAAQRNVSKGLNNA